MALSVLSICETPWIWLQVYISIAIKVIKRDKTACLLLGVANQGTEALQVELPLLCDAKFCSQMGFADKQTLTSTYIDVNAQASPRAVDTV
jgi:hypothetical protein